MKIQSFLLGFLLIHGDSHFLISVPQDMGQYTVPRPTIQPSHPPDAGLLTSWHIKFSLSCVDHAKCFIDYGGGDLYKTLWCAWPSEVHFALPRVPPLHSSNIFPSLPHFPWQLYKLLSTVVNIHITCFLFWSIVVLGHSEKRGGHPVCPSTLVLVKEFFPRKCSFFQDISYWI